MVKFTSRRESASSIAHCIYSKNAQNCEAGDLQLTGGSGGDWLRLAWSTWDTWGGREAALGSGDSQGGAVVTPEQ